MITTNAFTSNRTRDIQNQMGSSVVSKSNQEELNSTNTTSFMDELNAINKTKELEEKKDYSKYTYEELRKIPYKEAIKHREEIINAYQNIPRKYRSDFGHVGELADKLYQGYSLVVPPISETGNYALDKKMYDMYIKADVLNNPQKEVDLLVVRWEIGLNAIRMSHGQEPRQFGHDPFQKRFAFIKEGVYIDYAHLLDVSFNIHKRAYLSENTPQEYREDHKRYAEIYKELKSAF